jgi:hypothetical protein
MFEPPVLLYPVPENLSPVSIGSFSRPKKHSFPRDEEILALRALSLDV